MHRIDLDYAHAAMAFTPAAHHTGGVMNTMPDTLSITLSLDEIEHALDAIADARAAVDTLATHLHQRSVPTSIPSSIGTLRACLTLLRVQLQSTVETEAAAT
jgi:hypothetical protein